jgi:hypothetical protein
VVWEQVVWEQVVWEQVVWEQVAWEQVVWVRVVWVRVVWVRVVWVRVVWVRVAFDQHMFSWPNSIPIHLGSLFSQFRYRKTTPRPFPTDHHSLDVSALYYYLEVLGIIFVRPQSSGLGMTFVICKCF